MKSIRTTLLVWYIGSLIITSLFFWFGIHEYMLHYGVGLFVVLVITLSSIGFFIIYRFIQSISSLTEQMKQITDESLNTKVAVNKDSSEIATLSTTFNDLLSRLYTAFHREQQFISDIAHELKTPLATMKTSLELSLDKNDNAQSRALLEEVNRLSDTLKDVLDLAWTESKNIKKGKTVRLSHLVEDVSEIAEKLGQQKNLKVVRHIQSDIEIHGHKDKLARAFLNLIDNAVKYTEKGTVSITLKHIGTSVLFIVDDTGPGIAKKEKPHIFTRFYRGKKTDSIFGSGLGLAITKSIVKMHNGVVEVDSTEGKGSRFIIRFPSS